MNHHVQKILSVIFVFLTLPLWAIIVLAIYLEDGGPIIFRQIRRGKGQDFTLYKFRTMVRGAEKRKQDLMYLNEAAGPAFKIQDDPRFTKLGKFLSKTGLDELPQLINVIKGDMDLIGPRPLPIDEARKIPKKYKKREGVLPGITSLWIVKGAHNLSFKEWMELDLKYIKEKSLLLDVKIAFLTALLMLKGVLAILRINGKS